MKRTMLLTTAIIFAAGMSFAAVTTDGLIADFTAQGYTRIEVKTGPTQTKVEAIKGTEKLEVIYDTASGTVLKSETETVRPGEDTAPGVEIDSRNRDFVRVISGLDDDEDDDHGGHGGDDDNDDDDSDDDNDDDDDDDDHSGHGGGDDDDDSDDDSDHDSDDDNGGDDNGGDSNDD